MKRGPTSQCIAKETTNWENILDIFYGQYSRIYFSQYKYVNLEDMLLVSGIGRQDISGF